MRRMTALLLVLLGTLAALPARAEMDETARAERWADLSHALFGDRSLADGAQLIAIEAPDRAQDAAIVPLRVALAPPLAKEVRRLWLVIDNNPSPLAGLFTFGPAADPEAIATRVRVDDYTYIHAVAEGADGTLYAAQRFIKASGGCSAPAGKDQTAALQRLGRMKMSFKDAPRLGEPATAQLLISHPNNSGLQMDQLTRQYVPADFIQQVRVTYGGELVFTLDSDIALSEDPSIRFEFVARAPGELEVAVDDSSQRHFHGSWPVPPATE